MFTAGPALPRRRAPALNMRGAGTSPRNAPRPRAPDRPWHRPVRRSPCPVIPLLQPLFQGALAPLAERLQCAPEPPADALPASRLLEPDVLEALLRRYAECVWRIDVAAPRDLRAPASAWLLDYLGALVPPVAAAASVLGHAFPVALAELHVRLDAEGRVRDFHLASAGTRMPAGSTADRYDALVWRHWHPLFGALERVARVPPKVLWSNAARHLEAVLEQAAQLAPHVPAIAGDTAVLLHTPEWPAPAPDGAAAPAGPARANPLCRPRRVVPMATAQGTVPVALHRECCLYYLLPGEGYCGRCPLDPCHRSPRTPHGGEARAPAPSATAPETSVP